jgi:sporulation protein YlmC with PRC-barrel domain
MNARSVLSFIATAALTGSVMAQQVPANERPQATEAQNEQTKRALRQAVAVLDKRRASTIIGKDVTGQDGATIGEVKDLILDEQGKVTHAVISHGGTAGINARQVAIPWDSVVGMVRNDSIVIDRKQLQSAPALPEAPSDFTSDWSREFDRYWQRLRSAVTDEKPAGQDPQRR